MAEQLFTIEQAAAKLGKSVTTLRRLLKDKKIGCYGGRNETKRFSDAHISDYLNSVEQGREIEVVQKTARTYRRKKVSVKTRPRTDHYFAEFLI